MSFKRIHERMVMVRFKDGTIKSFFFPELVGYYPKLSYKLWRLYTATGKTEHRIKGVVFKVL